MPSDNVSPGLHHTVLALTLVSVERGHQIGMENA